ncbi:MAG: hypothetical protein ACK4UO_08290 [Pseudolabrys sp.]
MARTIDAFVFAVLTALVPAVAAAQAPPATKPPVAPKVERLSPDVCAEHDTRATEGRGHIDETRPPGPRAGENLGDKLARSDGVICPPPHADSEIRAPTPPAGRMLVIPPPDSQGGDPGARPK